VLRRSSTSHVTAARAKPITLASATIMFLSLSPAAQATSNASAPATPPVSADRLRMTFCGCFSISLTSLAAESHLYDGQARSFTSDIPRADRVDDEAAASSQMPRPNPAAVQCR
jgi:hypothetical protein